MNRAGIDIGAHSLRLVIEKEGLVFDEPALGAFNAKDEILAIGNQALDLKGESPDVMVKAPIQDGQVDFPVLEAILNELCFEFRLFRFFQKTQIIVSYPTSLDENLIDRLKDSLMGLGAFEIYFDQEIWMAAIGSGLDLFLPVASCVLTVGYSNCDIALFCNGKIEQRWSSRVYNGAQATERIQDWFLYQENMEVAPATIDQLIRNFGTVRISNTPKATLVRGIDVSTQVVRERMIHQNEIAAILAPLARDLSAWVMSFLEEVPDHYRLDLAQRGIVASGGTMKIEGLAQTIENIADCPVYLTDRPDRTVAKGLELLLATLHQ